jgi:polynucleotide 5'-kinase involved in rRNA processing
LDVSTVGALTKEIRRDSVVLFLGGTDAGKTTLIRALHERVGGQIIDGDIGQSWIGPPAVVSLGTPDGVHAGYFVGDVSPRGSLLQVITGIALMARRAERPCLIDTDGYIADGTARAYKTELINLVQPELLVLMQRRDELEYYTLYARKGIGVITLPVRHRSEKTREERIRAREQAFRNYFRPAEQRRFPLGGVYFERGLLGRGERLDTQMLSVILGREVKGAWKIGREATIVLDGTPQTLGTAKHVLDVDTLHLVPWANVKDLLVGCLHNGEYRGLGIVKDLTTEDVALWTPVDRTDVLQLGSLHVDVDGRHEAVRLASHT